MEQTYKELLNYGVLGIFAVGVLYVLLRYGPAWFKASIEFMQHQKEQSDQQSKSMERIAESTEVTAELNAQQQATMVGIAKVNETNGQNIVHIKACLMHVTLAIREIANLHMPEAEKALSHLKRASNSLKGKSAFDDAEDEDA